MVPNTDLSRVSIGGTASYTISEKFTTSFTGNYTTSHSDNFVTQGYNNENPVQQMIWSGRNVDFNALRDWKNLPLSPAGTAAAGTPLNWNTVFQNNPYWVLDTNTREYNRNRLVGNITANYEFNEHFSITGKVGTNFWNTRQNYRQAMGSNSAPNGYYSETARTYAETNYEMIASYNTNITQDLDFEFTVGGNSMVRKSELAYTAVPELQLPELYNVSNLRAGSSWVVNNSHSEQKINSLFGFGKFSYKDFLFLEFSGRNDWSSLLPIENNSFFYPSVTASVVISDMVEMNQNAVSFLKVRGGWSQVGGIGALSPYSLQPTYGLGATWGGNPVAFLPGQLNNPNIKSETTSGMEVGVDARFLNNSLRFIATYYDQTSKDLVVPVQVTAASGYTSAISNVGEMKNTGIELQLGATIVDNGDFKFDLDLNWAKNNNEVVSLGGLDALVLGGQWSMTLEAREGESYGSIVGSYFERTDGGEVIYENGLPVIADGTKILGNITPDWTGGANFNFSYKGFALNALLDAKIGGDIYTMTTTWGRYAGVLEETLKGRETGIVGDGVMLDGSGSYIPNNVVVTAEAYNKRAYSNSIVEPSVFDASYVKLRQMMLTYTIPSKLLAKSSISDIRVSAVARNLAILYKNVPHIDPESAFSDDNAEQGQEFGQLPSARSIGFNILLKL